MFHIHYRKNAHEICLIWRPYFLLQVLMPVLVNKNNHSQWPEVVSTDVLKHVYLLKNRVHVLAGQVKGKTLLPLPAGRQFNTCFASGDMYIFFRYFIFYCKISFLPITIKYTCKFMHFLT